MSVPDFVKEKIAIRIAGEITLGDKPGEALRKWRKLFGIPQIELAKFLNVSPSVISDYEGGRRESPGTKMIKKLVNALITIDEMRGGEGLKMIAKLVGTDLPADIILDMREFSRPVPIRELIEVTEAKVLANEDLIDRPVFGYSIIDSIEAIKKLSGNEFSRLFGLTTERALIFTKVTTGKSPMVAVRVSIFKPSLVMLHKPENVHPLAIELARIERIPLALVGVEPKEELIERLRSIK